MKADQIWQAALGELQLEMTRATFDTWLRGTRLVAYEDGTFIVGVRNGYAKDWLEHRLRPNIERVVSRLASRTVEVRFVVCDDPVEEASPEPLLAPPDTPSENGQVGTPLNPRYTMETFVVGPANRLAVAAASAVIERPAEHYNPLFIYGGTGLGKTHLLHAIGNACQRNNLRTIYVPAETFTNEYIQAIRDQTTAAFRETYRNADVLLVDDFQFIAGKEATQEEFFHTFNALHSNGGQIVVTSDRRPQALAALEERLRSRFEWGLIVDIRPPELETRIAILQQKAEGREREVPTDVLYVIAQRVQSNVRELEGTLNKVLAISSVNDVPLTPQLVEAALADWRGSLPEITAEQVFHTVAQFYRLTEDELCGSSRVQRLARPRQVAMYLMRQEAHLSLSQIGAALGGRDHTTVLHACERISALLERDDTLRQEVLTLRERLYQGDPLAGTKHPAGAGPRRNASLLRQR
jgi:chromosomal replication initiator protein